MRAVDNSAGADAGRGYMMNGWQFLSQYMGITITILVLFALLVCVLIFILVILIFVPSRKLKNLINEYSFSSLEKATRKLISEGLCQLVFASSDEDDHPPGYEQVYELFTPKQDIVRIDLNTKQFDAYFGKYQIIAYKVHHTEFIDANPKKDYPVYLAIAKYCAERSKDCILFTGSGRLDFRDPVFNSMHVTTVNFYSKLRETVYMLLFFRKKGQKTKQLAE